MKDPVTNRVMINSLEELLNNFALENMAQLSALAFDATDCGAYVAQHADGPGAIVVGSIVEGVDYGTEPIELEFPFTIKDFYEALEKTDLEADVIWRDTHGCSRCEYEGFLNPETGYVMVNPECPACFGHGEVH